jgi:long-subunit acyl-CoA synthetase (AMP-forming)
MKSIIQLLDIKSRGSEIIARDSNQTLTLTGLVDGCAQLVHELASHRIQTLALHADNSVNWLLIDLACQQAGICLVPLPTFFSAEQLQHVFDTAPIDALICEKSDQVSLDQFALINHGRIKYRLDSGIEGFQLVGVNSPVSSSVLPENTGKITFTSGSTGSPKGVCLSNQQMIKQAQALVEAVDLRHPRHLCLLPLSTLLENVAGLYAPLLADGEVFIPGLAEVGFEGSSSINPLTLVTMISQFQPDTLILIPQLLVVLVAAAKMGWQPPETLKFVAVGGSRVSESLLQEAHELGIPAFEGYGLSECASVVSLNTRTNQNHKSSGRPLPHLSVEIVGDDMEGEIKDGEIVVTGNAMLGYVGEPASWGKDAIRTGDIGHTDPDGYLHINGRIKNVLISSYGRNINPEWVESELLGFAKIAECVVFGDAKPYCVALIAVRDPTLTGNEIQALVDSANRQLPDYARIASWARLSEPLARQPVLGQAQSCAAERGARVPRLPSALRYPRYLRSQDRRLAHP